MASSAVSRIRNSPIHIVKMKNYGTGIDLRSVRDLAEVFRLKGRRKESDRNYRGRKISNFVTNKLDKKDMLSAWDKKSKPWPVNIIPHGPSTYPYGPMITKKDSISDNEILRPEIKFTSNARPSLLKWRELEIEATKIKPPSVKQKYKERLEKKYSSIVPTHLGYARNFVEYREPLRLKRFQKSSPRYPGSSLTWLPSLSYGNGLPQTIFHLKYPLKTRKLNSANDFITPVDNFL